MLLNKPQEDPFLPQAKPRSILISKTIDPAGDDVAKPLDETLNPKSEIVQAQVVVTLQERMACAATVNTFFSF